MSSSRDSGSCSKVVLRKADEDELTQLSTKLKGVGAGKVRAILRLQQKKANFTTEDLVRETKIPMEMWEAWEKEGLLELPKVAMIDVDVFNELKSRQMEELESSLRKQIMAETEEKHRHQVAETEEKHRREMQQMKEYYESRSSRGSRRSSVVQSPEYNIQKTYSPIERDFSFGYYESPQTNIGRLEGQPGNRSTLGATAGATNIPVEHGRDDQTEVRPTQGAATGAIAKIPVDGTRGGLLSDRPTMGVPGGAPKVPVRHHRFTASSPVDDAPPILTPQRPVNTMIGNPVKRDSEPELGNDLNVHRDKPELDNTFNRNMNKVLPQDGVYGNTEPRLGKFRPLDYSKDRQASKLVLQNGVIVHIHQGDLVNMKVGAIVNAANEQLQHGGGLARAISVAAGPGFQVTSQNMVAHRGPISVTEAVPQEAHRMPCRYVIHSVGPRYNQCANDMHCQQLLEQTFFKALLCAGTECGVQSVGLPFISSGIFGVPLHIVVEAMVEALLRYSMLGMPPLTEIHVVDADARKVKMLRHELGNAIGIQAGRDLKPTNLGLPPPVQRVVQAAANMPRPNKNEKVAQWREQWQDKPVVGKHLAPPRPAPLPKVKLERREVQAKVVASAPDQPSSSDDDEPSSDEVSPKYHDNVGRLPKLVGNERRFSDGQEIWRNQYENRPNHVVDDRREVLQPRHAVASDRQGPVNPPFRLDNNVDRLPQRDGNVRRFLDRELVDRLPQRDGNVRQAHDRDLAEDGWYRPPRRFDNLADERIPQQAGNVRQAQGYGDNGDGLRGNRGQVAYDNRDNRYGQARNGQNRHRNLGNENVHRPHRRRWDESESDDPPDRRDRRLHDRNRRRDDPDSDDYGRRRRRRERRDENRRRYSDSSDEGRRHRQRPRGPQLPKMPMFDGNNWNTFIFQFKRQADRFDWNDDDKLDRLLCCLQGKAVDYIVNRPPEICENYRVLVGDLKQRFSKRERPLTARNLLANLCQKEDEKLEDFSDRTIEAVRDSYPQAPDEVINDMAVTYFLTRSLDKSAASKAMDKDPVTLAEAVDEMKSAICKKEAVYQTNGHDSKGTGQVRLLNYDSDNYDTKVVRWEDEKPEVKRLNYNNRYSAEEKPYNQLQSKDTEVMQLKSDLQDLAGMMRKQTLEMAELAQLVKGRYSPASPKPGATPPRGKGGSPVSSACFACGLVGHYIRDCPTKQGQRSSPNRTAPGTPPTRPNLN